MAHDYIDVWLRFSPIADHEEDHVEEDQGALCPICEEAEAEANTRLTDTGYAVDWYLNAVGLVSTVEFDTLSEAYDWYEDNGYQDFTA